LKLGFELKLSLRFVMDSIGESASPIEACPWTTGENYPHVGKSNSPVGKGPSQVGERVSSIEEFLSPIGENVSPIGKWRPTIGTTCKLFVCRLNRNLR
jgi:hypothetical protein